MRSAVKWTQRNGAEKEIISEILAAVELVEY